MRAPWGNRKTGDQLFTPFPLTVSLSMYIFNPFSFVHQLNRPSPFEMDVEPIK